MEPQVTLEHGKTGIPFHPDEMMLNCPECLESYNNSDRRKVKEDICGHVKCRVCCVYSETCATCLTKGSEYESFLTKTQLRRVNEAFEYFKCLRCLIKCGNCIMCYPKVEVPAEPLIQSQLYAVSASTPTTTQLQKTEFASPSSTKSNPVYPTKRHQPRMALSPVWSGPNPKTACEIGNIQNRWSYQERTSLTAKLSLVQSGGLEYILYFIVISNKEETSTKRNVCFKQFAQIWEIGDASGISYYNVGLQKASSGE
ncbi:unnamed protein product [Orchesella dallaii]|uniref:RING-type domain-containing protein n=1 Tax=Orchesella dallaii TaxID=48710 RepID=A0ABP1Q9L5_9HEXA